MERSKLVPRSLMTLQGSSAVVRIIAYPPNTAPQHAPIVRHLWTIECICENGATRWFGFTRAWIGSDLRMHVTGINPRDEIVSRWEDGE